MQQKRMLLSVVLVLLCVLSIFCLRLVTARSYDNGLIFYDLKTFRTYLPPTVSVSRGRVLAKVKFSEKGSIWSTFGKPCECRNKVCGCCAGIKVKQYNFDQKMCANVTFIPPSEEALLDVYLNERPSSKYGISVRNPSPFCIPVMMGIPMAMCVQLTDITIKGNNLNMCMDFIVRLATTDLFEMHFQCMQMGLDGFQYIDKDGKPVIPPGNSKTQNDDDYEYDYDETNENEIANVANKDDNATQQQKQQQQQQQYYQVSSNILDSTYIIGLQQQMQQLQNAQLVKIQQDDLVTQISDETTLLPIVGEVKTEIIEAITDAYGTPATTTEIETETTNANVIQNDEEEEDGEGEIEIEDEKDVDLASTEKETDANIVNSNVGNPQTETESETESQTEAEIQAEFEAEAESETESATTTESETKDAANINPVNNELEKDAPDNNYLEMPGTAVSSDSANSTTTTTTEAIINKPIASTINAYMDATTAAATTKATTTTTASEDTVGANVYSIELENFTTPYATNGFDSTVSDFNIETTPMTIADPVAAFIDAPMEPTAAFAIDAVKQNSTSTLKRTPIMDVPQQNTTGNIDEEDLHVNETHQTVIPSATDATPEAPVTIPSANALYRHFYGWSWH